MKCWKTTEVLAVAVLLLCAASAVAAATSSKTRMTVIAPVSVGGKTLAPGNYQVTWEGSGKVQLSFVRAKKVVATAPATIQPRNTVNSDETVLVTEPNGELVEIRPEGMKEALVLGTPSGQ